MRRSPPAGLLLGAVLASFLHVPGQEPQAPRGRRGTLAIHVGVLHPVSGPAIRDAVLLVRGPRIAALGPKDRVRVPEGARLLDLPHAHAYPGLVDALSSVFADKAVRNDTATDAGTRIVDGLDPFDPASRHVVEAGVTTAFVSNRGATAWRGLGALVRPRAEGFTVMRGGEEVAVSMRVGGPHDRTHPLARQQALRRLGKAFEALEAYEKQHADYRKALEKYRKDFAAYLAWHRKKNKGKTPPRSQEGRDKAGKGQGTRGRAGKGPRALRRQGRGRPRPSPSRGSGKGVSPTEPDAKGAAKAPAAGGSGARPAGSTEKAPARPKRPRKPKKDPAKEALLKVKKGELPLRVEAHRPDEIRAVLDLARRFEIPHVVLEIASGAAPLASRLADAGVPVVVAGIEPGFEREDGIDHARLAARLSRAGVAVAIGSGTTPVRHLPVLAALAVSKGMDPDDAVRALTLTPARILRIADRVGSLERGKIADVLITDAPLLDARCRVLRVLSAGRTVFEAKP